MRRTKSSGGPRFPRFRRRRGLVLVVWALVCACSGPAAPPGPPIEAVEVPPDLPELDPAVRIQLDELSERLRELASETPSDPDELGDAWGALGRWYDVYHYADRAGRCYRNARALDPDEPRWPYHLGVLAATAGDLEAARELFQAALALAPEEHALRVRLGDLALDRRDFEQAEFHYAEVLAASPDDPGALLGTGRAALMQGDARRAIDPLERIARLQPEASQVQYSLGLARRMLGEEARAAEHFARVPAENLDQVGLKLDSPWDRELQSFDRGARTLTRRGIRAFRRGEPARAAQLLGAAVAADPDGAEKRINYALALHKAGFPQAAREELETALDVSAPDSELRAKSHLELGRLLGAVGRPVEAERHLEASLAIDSASLPARLELGRQLQQQGRLDEALEHYAFARDGGHPSPGTCFWHAALLIANGRPDEARRALEEDLERLGDERLPGLLLARVLSAGPSPTPRDLERARALLAKGAEMKPDPDVIYAETAAMVAAASGRFPEALAWQEAAVEALGDIRRRRASHAARRRLAVYRSGEPAGAAWEATESVVALPVKAPGVPR